MTRQNQTDLELAHVRRAQSLCPAFPQGTPRATGGGPDFLVVAVDGRITGVEHTIAMPEEAQKAVKLLEQVLTLLAERAPLRIPHLRLVFSGHLQAGVKHPGKGLLAMIDGLLAHLSKKISALPEADSWSLRYVDVQDDEMVRDFIGHVGAWRLPDDYPQNEVWLSHADMLNSGVEAVRRALGEKEGKLSRYREKAPRVTLLIVAPGHLVRGHASVSKVMEHAFETAFDEVFLLEQFSGQCVRLNTRPLPAVGAV